MSTNRAALRRGILGRIALAACFCSLLPGCFTFQHTVGRGPMSPKPVKVEDTQWFAFWGLLPLGEHDSQKLAGSTRDYRVTTEFNFMDVVITTFTSFVTLYRQTIVVEK